MSRLDGFLDDLRSPAAQALPQHEAAQHVLTDVGAAALERTASAEHFTASCIVFDPRADMVLLHHHRRADAWGQFGGHIEPSDTSFREAAHREYLEESGLQALDWLSPTPVDIHLHRLRGDFGPCTAHRDIVYAGVADSGARTEASAESHAVAWFPLRSLPSGIMSDLPGRLPGLIDTARRLLRPHRG